MDEDIWRFFLTELGGERASILFNDSLADRIDALDLPVALKLRAQMKSPRPDGLRSDEEFETLTALEDQLEEAIGAAGGVFLGHILAGGHLYMNFLVAEGSTEAFDTAIAMAQKETGYEIRHLFEPDPEKTSYWDALYPSADERQQLMDLETFEALDEHGDEREKPRKIEHWAGFEGEEARALFQDEVEARGFATEELWEEADKAPTLWIRFSRQDAPTRDLTEISIALNRKARELGGVYDGWETPVVSPETSRTLH